MGLEHVRRTYEEYGREDPFYAVLSVEGRERGGWDPEAFYATGRREVGRVLEHVRSLGLRIPSGTALDFGCGAGRLSLALADHFDGVVGVDISSSMLDTARRHNEHGERVRFRLNVEPHLEQFASDRFAFIYSNITLQHVPRRPAEAYIAEFFRVLAPGGVAVFQVPNGRPWPLDSLGHRLTAFVRGPLRRFSKRIRGKKTVEIHYVPRPRVEEMVADAGCEIVEAHDLAGGRKRWGSYRYCVRKPSRPDEASAGAH
jgi:ubiquinone/menaquinone biosynthesis C-methylase UbiE